MCDFTITKQDETIMKRVSNNKTAQLNKYAFFE